MKTTSLDELKAELFKNPEFKKEYDSLEEEFQIAKDIIRLRIELNLSQAQLAKMAGTSQPAISRLESGNYKNLTLSFLRKIGKVLGVEPVVHFQKLAGV